MFAVVIKSIKQSGLIKRYKRHILNLRDYFG